MADGASSSEGMPFVDVAAVFLIRLGPLNTAFGPDRLLAPPGLGNKRAQTVEAALLAHAFVADEHLSRRPRKVGEAGCVILSERKSGGRLTLFLLSFKF